MIIRSPYLRMPRLLCLMLAAVAVNARPTACQVVRGVVVEQMSLARVQGASVVLFRVDPGDELEPVGMTATDEEGNFALTTPGPGVYRVQADRNDLSSPLSPRFDLAAADAVAEVELLLPSTVLQSALMCVVEAGDSAAAVVGVVRDATTEVPLPGAIVLATWQEGRLVRRLETAADGAGRYRLCPPSAAGQVTFQTYLLGKWVRHQDIEISGPVIVIQDLNVALPSTARPAPDVIHERILQEAARNTLADLRGEILDRDSDAPVRYAVVRLQGTNHQAFSDEAGRFLLTDLRPDAYTLEIRSIGYEVVTAPLELPAGKDVFLGLRLAPQAVEIEGVVVTARASAEEAIRVTPFRRNIAYGEIMALEEERGARAFETLRRYSPGLRVTERERESGPRELCITTSRRIQSLQPPDPAFRLLSQVGNTCPNVQVVVDGVRIPDGPDFLLRTPAGEIESIEFVTPVHAQILYGIGGDTANGVVVVYTRGKGPYVSPLRNR